MIAVFITEMVILFKHVIIIIIIIIIIIKRFSTINFNLDMFRFFKNPFPWDRSPTFWHESQMSARAGLIWGQIPHCTGLTSSQMPGVAPFMLHFIQDIQSLVWTIKHRQQSFTIQLVSFRSVHTFQIAVPRHELIRKHRQWKKKLNAVYLSVSVFSTKVLIGDTIFTSSNGDGTAILRGHPSHAKVSPLAVQRKYLHFSVILRPWVMVRPRESNPRPPALQSNALPTELILPQSGTIQSEIKRKDYWGRCE